LGKKPIHTGGDLPNQTKGVASSLSPFGPAVVPTVQKKVVEDHHQHDGGSDVQGCRKGVGSRGSVCGCVAVVGVMAVAENERTVD